MTSVKFNFRGLMAPVFTAFNDDDRQTVNYNIIDGYAKYLKSKNVNGVLINGTTGEGQALSKEERFKLAEAWKVACTKYAITMMVQIGGAPIADVIDLAIHAEKIKADAVLCLPELYFKPKTETDLVKYIATVAKYCPNTPFLYYHFPKSSSVDLSMPKFLDLADETIPNFMGLKYTSGDLEQGAACLKPNRGVFLGSDTILCGAFAMGFDSTIMTTLSICPETSINIVNALNMGKVSDAFKHQLILNARITQILRDGNGDWVPSMKKEFNKLNVGLNTGLTRRPF